MISRRNFLTVTMIMLILLFMFQVPEVVKDRWNHYSINTYEEKTKTAYTSEDVSAASREDAKRTGRYAVYIGDCEDMSTGTVVSQWGFYTKRYLETYRSLSEYSLEDEKDMPEVLILDSAYLDFEKDTKKLTEFVNQGMNLIFCNLPDSSVIGEQDDLRQLLGIRYIRTNQIQVEGIHLFEGLLLGGEKYYIAVNEEEEKRQDLELNMPWYHVSSGTKTYMVGMLDEAYMDEQEVENEDLPAVIWRNSIGTARIFAVNGDYLADNAGIGFLDGMMTEMETYEIYPVINAQNLVMVNYPGFTNENNEEIMNRYSQSLKAVYRDIVWPGITTVAQRSNAKLTYLISPQTDYQDEIEPEKESVIYYMKLLQEQNAEAGLSGACDSGTEISEKLRQDEKLLSNTVPNYPILSFYPGRLTDTEIAGALQQSILGKVRTLYRDYEKACRLVGYADDGVTVQSATNDGYSHTYSENIRMNAIETALAYSSILTDISRVAYPESDEDSWEKLYDKFASNTDTYWKAYQKFEGTTLAESDKRIREFLALDYTEERNGDVLKLQLENFGEEAWFLLRTHGEEIVSAEAAEYDRIEEGAYLVKALSNQVELTLQNTDKRYYYH